jgi:drug/metabolite transporter (DMT)-like permease
VGPGHLSLASARRERRRPAKTHVEAAAPACLFFGEESLRIPDAPDHQQSYNNLHLDNSSNSRRWTVIVSGLLCCVLAFVVIYTTRRGLSSPLAIVVLAAVGLLALILQLRLRTGEQRATVHAPLWLNLGGILFALAALGADLKRIRPDLAPLFALLAVVCFAISSATVLQGLRRQPSSRDH